MLEIPPPDPGIEIVVASRGYSKGLAQTDGVQLRAQPELAFGPAYLAFYAKNVTSSSSEGEAGAIVGLRTRAGGFDLAASATWKMSIEPRGRTNDDALELVGSIGRRFGPVNARLSVTWSPNDLGATNETLWTEGNVSYSLCPSTSISAALGRRERDGGPDYSAFNLGVTQTLLPGLSADLRWYDTDRSGLGDAFERRLIASLRMRL
jgi:hypothetical protein